MRTPFTMQDASLERFAIAGTEDEWNAALQGKMPGKGSKFLSVKRKHGSKDKHAFEAKGKAETPKSEEKDKKEKKSKKSSASKRLKGT